MKFCHWEDLARKPEDDTPPVRTSRESAPYDYVDERCINQTVQPPPYLDVVSDKSPREGMVKENTESGFVNTTGVQPHYTELDSEKREADDTNRYESLQN